MDTTPPMERAHLNNHNITMKGYTITSKETTHIVKTTTQKTI